MNDDMGDGPLGDVAAAADVATADVAAGALETDTTLLEPGYSDVAAEPADPSPTAAEELATPGPTLDVPTAVLEPAPRASSGCEAGGLRVPPAAWLFLLTLAAALCRSRARLRLRSAR